MSLTLLCLLIVIYPLFAGPGPVNTRGGGDSPFLLIRLEQLVAGLRAGAFPVRWMPDAAYGLGYPFFNFYAALPYYVAALFRLCGWGPILSLQFTQAIGFVLAATTMALLARHVLYHPAAVTLAVIAYTCAPFHLTNVYVRGDSLSEFYAFVFYPLILWSLSHLRDHPSLPSVVWLALSYGGLFLTHNLSFAMFTPFALGYALFLLWPSNRERANNLSLSATGRRRSVAPTIPSNRERVNNHSLSAIGRRRSAAPTIPPSRERANNPSLSPTTETQKKGKEHRVPCVHHVNWKTALLMMTGGILGLALSACLWLSMLDDLDAVWMGHKMIQTSGYFNYAGHFRGLDLVQPTLLFDYDETPGHTPFAMGAMQAALILSGTIFLAAGWLRQDRTSNFSSRPSLSVAFWVAGFALSTFMITPASRLLWDHLPVLPIVQFPWRFLSVQALFGAMIVGELARRLPKSWLTAAVGAALLTFTVTGGLRPEYLPIQESDVTPERLALFESFTANIGTTIRGEYLPVAVEPQIFASAVQLNHGQKPSPIALSGQITRATLVRQDARSEHWHVTVPSEQTHMAFYTLYFPGWQAKVDGEAVGIESLSNSGLISIYVPSGEHEITLRFERTTVRWIADLASLAAVLVTVALAWPLIREIRHISRQCVQTIIVGGLLLVSGTVLLGSVLSTPRWVSFNDLSMDFDRLPFLHHNPYGIDFGGRVRLSSYTYDAETVQGGVPFTLTLAWAQTDSNSFADVQLVTPADAHPRFAPPPPPLASARAYIEGQTTTHVLPIPVDAASGLYYVSLRVFDGKKEVKALTTQGNTLGTTYLRPVWIDNPRPAVGDEPLRAHFGDRILLRDDVQVKADEENWNVRLTWQAVTDIPVNYTCSLRMLAADGTPIPQAQRDFEGGPGHGFWPTLAWPTGEWVTDHLRVPVPPGVRAEDAAALAVVLYDRSQPDFPAAGSAVVPLIEREHLYSTPEMEHTVGATFGERVKLLGYNLTQDAALLHLTLHWQATRQMSTDYTVFVHLFDQAAGAIVSQVDARPLNGTYPTNWWRVGEIVSDEIMLPLSDVPEGRYSLAVGLYDASNYSRLPAITTMGDTLPDGRLILKAAISIADEP